MKNILPILLLLFGLTLSCTNAQKTSETTKNKNNIASQVSSSNLAKLPDTTLLPNTMIDPRDGEIYTTVTIGKQIWMAENLRFSMPGSMWNVLNPSKEYGRLYNLIPAQTACPPGWHLPSDSEWDELEIAHGMPESFIGKGGWRGAHAPNMRSTSGWFENGNGTDTLGFKVLPAGYYFSEEVMGENAGIEGLGFSAAFWSSMGNGKGWARFMFSAREFVNKWDDDDRGGAALSCRCVKD